MTTEGPKRGRGGRRDNAGRNPMYGERMPTFHVSLPAEDAEYAREYGGGNLSEGLRLLVQDHRRPEGAGKRRAKAPSARPAEPPVRPASPSSQVPESAAEAIEPRTARPNPRMCPHCLRPGLGKPAPHRSDPARRVRECRYCGRTTPAPPAR